jgi:hypothetical protein
MSGGGSRDGEESGGGGGGSGDTQSSAEGAIRLVTFLTSPALPLEKDALLGLPPKMPLKAIVKEDDCPEKVVFYHGWAVMSRKGSSTSN